MIERKHLNTSKGLKEAYNESYRRSPFGETARFYRWVLKLLRVPAGGQLLDIGCGAGGLVRQAGAQGISAIGVDLSNEAVAQARAADEHGRYLIGNGERLPFADGQFQWITHLGNLEHFLDPVRGAAELNRLLRVDGQAAIMLPNSYYSGDLWRVIRTGRGPDHHQAIDRFATVTEWWELLEEAGLQVMRTVPYNKFKLWKRLLPKNLAYHFIFLCRRGS